MTVKIRETGEIKELSITDPKTGLNYISDFIGNTGAFNNEFSEYDEENEYYIAAADDVEWWENVIEVHEHANTVMQEFFEDADLEENNFVDIQATVQDVFSCDLDVFSSPAEFDHYFRGLIAGYGIKMTVYSDGSIGFEEHEQLTLVIHEYDCEGEGRQFQAYVQKHYPEIAIEYKERTSGVGAGLFDSNWDEVTDGPDLWEEYCNS